LLGLLVSAAFVVALTGMWSALLLSDVPGPPDELIVGGSGPEEAGSRPVQPTLDLISGTR
jgi:hypothetical protein